MLVVVTYDVNTETAEGKKRLAKVAKHCVNYGQRVQNSVFELLLDYAEFISFRAGLISLIDMEKDSVRFYLMGNKWNTKTEHYGKTVNMDQSGVLIL